MVLLTHDIPYFVIPLFVGCCAQVTKIVIDYLNGNPLNWTCVRASGGMPSTHGTLTGSLMMVVWLVDGGNSSLFAVVSVFSFLIRYDATNLRYESGRHAYYINSLKKEINQVLLSEHISDDFPVPYLSLKERIGHTPLEVLVGIVYGMSVTRLLMNLL